MKKSGLVIGILVISILIVSASLASASWIGDFWAKITGDSITGKATYADMPKPTITGPATCTQGQECEGIIVSSSAGSSSSLPIYYELWWDYYDASGGLISPRHCGKWGDKAVCTGLWSNTNAAEDDYGVIVSSGPISSQKYSFSEVIDNANEIDEVRLWARTWQKDKNGVDWHKSGWSEIYKIGISQAGGGGGIEEPFPVPTPPAQNITCTDSDGGITPNVYGWTDFRSDSFELKHEDACALVGSYDSTGTPTGWQSIDSCSGENCYIQEAFCRTDASGNFIDADADQLIKCSSGCSNGACINITAPTPTCTDSDGGLNYYVKGYLNTSVSPGIRFEDYCLEPNYPNQLIERHCLDTQNPNNFTVKYTCPNGCSNGACIKAPQYTGTCEALVNKVIDPSDFSDGSVDWKSSWSGSWSGRWWVNNALYDAAEYNAGWYAYYDNRNFNINYNIVVFNDTTVDLEAYLKERTSYDVCQVRSYWGADDKENKIYVCNWDVLREKQNIDDYQWKHRQVLWSKDNILVQAYTYTGRTLSDEEIAEISQQRLSEFLNNVQNNQAEFIGWEEFEIDYPLSRQIETALAYCPSEIPFEICSPCWSCKIEPIICPPHGYQTRTCADTCCNSAPTTTTQIGCSPGICSGCYVPKWFGYKLAESKCIPYGFRLEHQIGEAEETRDIEDAEKLYEKEMSKEISLKIVSAQEANLIVSENEQNITYILTPGQITDVTLAHERNITYHIEVLSISYTEGSTENYVDTIIRYSYIGTFPQTMNAYCDIDGEMKMQKSDDSSCQNSYECFSNLCSAGTCIGVKAELEKAGFFRRFVVNLLCRLSNIGDEEGYNQCVMDYLE